MIEDMDSLVRPQTVEAELRAAQVDAVMQAPPMIVEAPEARWHEVRARLALLLQAQDPASEADGWTSLVAGKPLAWWLVFYATHRPGMARAAAQGFRLAGHVVASYMAQLAGRHGGMPHVETHDRWTRYTFPDRTIYAFERAPQEGGPWGAQRDAWRQLDRVPVFPLDPDSAMAQRGPVASIEDRIAETCQAHDVACAICGCPTFAERTGLDRNTLPF